MRLAEREMKFKEMLRAARVGLTPVFISCLHYPKCSMFNA